MSTETEHTAARTGPDDQPVGGSPDSTEGIPEASAAGLSTAPQEDSGQAVPGSFGGVRRPGTWGALAWTGRELLGWGRWCWRQLTSMRVALILLFLLSLGAVPGSLIPQNNVDTLKVEEFREDHPTLSPIYDAFQLFDVYSSVWFSAIYLLLFISLIGCILPRSFQFVRQLRNQPPAAPRRLTRLPAYTTWHTEATPEEVLGAARGVLGRRRFRTARQGDAVSAEKGYLREVGNLAFHIALVVLLIAFGVGQLWKSEGGKLVIRGHGFANTLSQYDDFRSGTFFNPGQLDSFGFRLDDFHATFEESGSQRGTARDFRADITYWEGPDGPERRDSIEMNHPLTIGDSKVFLLGHGFAPVVSVTDGQGDVAYRGPVAFIPQDSNLTSSGVIKVTDYRDAKGERDQLGFQGFFVPTYEPDSGTMFSRFPALENPVLFLTAYRGDLGLDAGVPRNVYQLDTAELEQFTEEDGSPLAQMMQPGDTMELPNGAGTLKFEKVEQWATFQISSQRGSGWALGGALAAVVGLAGSLFIRRRRVWVRAVPAGGPGGRTVVEMAGLGRSESASLPEELGDLAVRLQHEAPPVDPETGGRPETEEQPEPGKARTAEDATPEDATPEDSASEDSAPEGSGPEDAATGTAVPDQRYGRRAEHERAGPVDESSTHDPDSAEGAGT